MLGGHSCWKASDVCVCRLYVHVHVCVRRLYIHVHVCCNSVCTVLVNDYVVNSLIPLHTACIIILKMVVSSILTVFCVRASMYTIQSNPSTHLCTYMYIHGWLAIKLPPL